MLGGIESIAIRPSTLTKNLKKLILTNVPYVVLGLYATKLGQLWRLAPGADASQKLLHLMDGLTATFQSYLPSFHPSDLLVGLFCGGALRLAAVCDGILLTGTQDIKTPLPERPPAGI